MCGCPGSRAALSAGRKTEGSSRAGEVGCGSLSFELVQAYLLQVREQEKQAAKRAREAEREKREKEKELLQEDIEVCGCSQQQLSPSHTQSCRNTCWPHTVRSWLLCNRDTWQPGERSAWATGRQNKWRRYNTLPSCVCVCVCVCVIFHRRRAGSMS